MIDFTHLPVRHKTYTGTNGCKISVLYKDELPIPPSVKSAHLKDHFRW